MALPPGQIPSPHEPFTNKDGVMTRTWYRVIAALTKNSGSLAQPILIPPNSFFVSGSIDSGGTLEPNTIASGSLLGNSSGSPAAASPQSVDSSLSLSGGILGLAKLAAFSLLGNPASVAATPSGLTIGAGLAVIHTVPPQLVATGGSSPGNPDLTAAQVLSWWRSG